ncbi:MAG: MMPL family transporter [Candidatus Aminicenantes bacterium]|nr:MMPL family transporter [Candidatus Aminicenantes bacterium]
MKTLADLVIRKRIIIIIVVAILTILLGYKMVKVKLNADFATYLRQEDPLVQQYNKLGDKFGGKSTAMILIETDEVFTEQNLKLVNDLTEAYREIEEVTYVTSLTSVLDFKKIEGGLEVGKLIPEQEIPQTKKELKELKEYVMSKEMYEGNLVSYDGTSTMIAIRLSQSINEYALAQTIKEITERIAPSTENIYFGGMPFLIYSMTEGILDSLNLLVPLMIFLLFFILYLGFRTVIGILLPLSVVVISAVWVIGLMVIFGFSLDMLSGIMPMILLAMGSADGIHLIKRYYEKRNSGAVPRLATREALTEMGVPMALTTITTMVGFISLVVSNFSVISQFGLVTALGVLLALVVSFTFLPSLLSVSKGKIKSSKRKRSGRVSKIMEKFAELIFKNKRIVLISAVVVVIVTVIAIPRIVKDVDWTLCLRRGTKPWQAEMLLRDKFKGSLPIQISIKGDIKEPSTLKTMRYLERYLETLPLVSKTQSLASVLSEMNEIMNDRFVVPETEAGVANLCFLIEGEDIMDQMVHGDYDEALIQARFGTMQTQKMASMSDSTDNFLEKLPEELVVVDIRDIPVEAQGPIIEIRKSRITDKILWDLKKRNIKIERNKIEELVGTALVNKELEEETLQKIFEKVRDYLLSEEAEVNFTSKKETEIITHLIVETVKDKGEIYKEQIGVIVRSNTNHFSSDDLMFLSESLERVVFEAIGESRVVKSLKEIINLIPSDTGKMKFHLRRDLKSDLWEMNENLVTLSKNEHKKFLNDFNVNVVKDYKLSFTHTGLVPVLKKMEEELTPTQVGSVLFALIFVTIILTFVFRSPMVGLISVIPIILTVLVNFAIIGYLKIGLDSFIAMIASIAIGLGIDYSVHFTSRFRRELAQLGDVLAALKRTFTTTGMAIIINTFSVGLGFVVLIMGPCQHVRMFGRLTALTMLTSTIFTLAVLPAITFVLKPRYIKDVLKKDTNKTGSANK